MIHEVIGTVAEVLYLPDVEAAARAEVLRRATVILAQNTATELTPDERALIHQVRLLQFYTAGVDFIPCRTCRPLSRSRQTAVRSTNRWRMRSP